MYLSNALIFNSGPLRDVSLSLKFDKNGNPIPLVFVGANGSGKTTILSFISDALIKFAKKAFVDIVPDQNAPRTPYFRVVGSTNRAVGAESTLSLLSFREDKTVFSYCEKTGHLDKADITHRLGAHFAEISWKIEEDTKFVTGTEETLTPIFRDGAYAFFPSSRAEIPHWLNVDSLDRDPKFDFYLKLKDRLSKPIFVEKNLDYLKPWILDVILDSRIDSSLIFKYDDIKLLRTHAAEPFTFSHSIANLNNLLQIILDDPDVFLACRNTTFGQRRLCIAKDTDKIVPSLDHLSSAQAILFSMFGTIIRYGETPHIADRSPLKKIQGIAIIDEADVHLHTGLQYDALPKIIKMGSSTFQVESSEFLTA